MRIVHLTIVGYCHPEFVGPVKSNLEERLHCDQLKVALVYRGELRPLLALLQSLKSTVLIKLTAMTALFNCLDDRRVKVPTLQLMVGCAS